jgi:hypothetical protein
MPTLGGRGYNIIMPALGRTLSFKRISRNEEAIPIEKYTRFGLVTNRAFKRSKNYRIGSFTRGQLRKRYKLSGSITRSSCLPATYVHQVDRDTSVTRLRLDDSLPYEQDWN